jgi:hypothetical protein
MTYKRCVSRLALRAPRAWHLSIRFAPEALDPVLGTHGGHVRPVRVLGAVMDYT